MYFEHFPTEIISHVFLSCSSIGDVLALSATCHRFRSIYSSSRKLTILRSATESQYGPLEDAIQLVTHNSSQPTHIVRSVPFSFALLKQLVRIGQTAEKWCDIYPFKKWNVNYQDRRLLTSDECYRLRRALYRLWLYTRAFHNHEHTRTQRMNLQSIQQRAELLRNWSTRELAEIADVHSVLRDVIHTNICPSNGTIARKFKKRYPDTDHQLLFNIHLNYPPPPFSAPYPMSEFHNPPPTHSNPLQQGYHHSAAVIAKYHQSKYHATAYHEPGAEGWGDDIGHYYVVEDMLKLDPEQILWLKENAPLKSMVESYIKGLGEWFENNGETWGQTLEWVLRERNVDVEEVMTGIMNGELGIALED
ncbi:uncharacterized protein PV09_00405 [Verruconis gallopava]|uniref:F-box domain-containing protein n=1 Tax=Verruconis gallopava TaxID=253628 RepID=A0A0D1Y3N6_9PEZI|nr:uncharacterized protein PV09_00405 [Verruconis gallopava]KIW09531.1 hypothetical protein PV09_00405 [Verruconis gallopava]